MTIEKNKEYYKSKTKEELINIALAYQAQKARLSNLNINKTGKIRHMEKRLLKIRKNIDFILKNPYSNKIQGHNQGKKQEGIKCQE